MTAELGELGRPRDPVDMTFLYFGETIRVGPHAGDLSLIEFLATADEIDLRDEKAATLAVVRLLREQVHPDDWATVIRLAREHHQFLSDLMQLARDIVAKVTRFPTGRPSASSGGPPSTVERSRDGYSSDVATAMQQAAGRPDLKMMIWMADQARAAQAVA